MPAPVGRFSPPSAQQAPAIKGGFHAATPTRRRSNGTGGSVIEHRHSDRRGSRLLGARCGSRRRRRGSAAPGGSMARCRRRERSPPETGGTSGLLAPGRSLLGRADRPRPRCSRRRAYIIVPPSVHPSGRVYSWRSTDYPPPRRPGCWASPAPSRSRPFPSVRWRASVRRTAGPAAYGLAALNAEVAALAAVAPGARNHALNLASFRLFSVGCWYRT